MTKNPKNPQIDDIDTIDDLIPDKSKPTGRGARDPLGITNVENIPKYRQARGRQERHLRSVASLDENILGLGADDVTSVNEDELTRSLDVVRELRALDLSSRSDEHVAKKTTELASRFAEFDLSSTQLTKLRLWTRLIAIVRLIKIRASIEQGASDHDDLSGSVGSGGERERARDAHSMIRNSRAPAELAGMSVEIKENELAYRKLCGAMFEQTIKDLFPTKGQVRRTNQWGKKVTKKEESKALQMDSLKWMFARTDDVSLAWPFHFRNVCEKFGVEPTEVQMIVLRLGLGNEDFEELLDYYATGWRERVAKLLAPRPS